MSCPSSKVLLSLCVVEFVKSLLSMFLTIAKINSIYHEPDFSYKVCLFPRICIHFLQMLPFPVSAHLPTKFLGYKKLASHLLYILWFVSSELETPIEPLMMMMSTVILKFCDALESLTIHSFIPSPVYLLFIFSIPNSKYKYKYK